MSTSAGASMSLNVSLNVDRAAPYRTEGERLARLARLRLLEDVAWDRFFASLGDGTNIVLVRAFMHSWLEVGRLRAKVEDEINGPVLAQVGALLWAGRRRMMEWKGVKNNDTDD